METKQDDVTNIVEHLFQVYQDIPPAVKQFVIQVECSVSDSSHENIHERVTKAFEAWKQISNTVEVPQHQACVGIAKYHMQSQSLLGYNFCDKTFAFLDQHDPTRYTIVTAEEFDCVVAAIEHLEHRGFDVLVRQSSKPLG